MKHPDGHPDQTAQDPTNSATATNFLYLIGPPARGARNTQGIYVRQIAGTAGTYRWTEDVPITGTSPTTFAYPF